MIKVFSLLKSDLDILQYSRPNFSKEASKCGHQIYRLVNVDLTILSHSRFIRARKHDLAAAKEMWTKYIEWRRDFGTDTIEKVGYRLLCRKFCIPPR